MIIERNLHKALQGFVTASALPVIVQILQTENVHLAFSNPRKQIIGYYKRPEEETLHLRSYSKHIPLESLHTISINEDLNPYAFFFVFMHEWAHLATRKKYGNQVSAHGQEWKQTFRKLFLPYINTRFFPKPLCVQLDRYFLKMNRFHPPFFSLYGTRKTFPALFVKQLEKQILWPAPQSFYDRAVEKSWLLKNGTEYVFPDHTHQQTVQADTQVSRNGTEHIVPAHAQDIQHSSKPEKTAAGTPGKLKEIPAGELAPGSSFIYQESLYEKVSIEGMFVFGTNLKNKQRIKIHKTILVKTEAE